MGPLAFEHGFNKKAVPSRWRSADRRCGCQFYFSRGAFLVRLSQGTANVLDKCGRLADLAKGARWGFFLPAAAARTAAPDGVLRSVRPSPGLPMSHRDDRGCRASAPVDTFSSNRCYSWGKQSGQPDSRTTATLASRVNATSFRDQCPSAPGPKTSRRSASIASRDPFANSRNSPMDSIAASGGPVRAACSMDATIWLSRVAP